tara:strand:+ start:2242 stop:3936 length:1695 start_codon:yes stop_codon:yes gene_type:complete
MPNNQENIDSLKIKNFEQFSKNSDYSLLNFLKKDPKATIDGNDHEPRQVFSGHYVPVTPKAINSPIFLLHSQILFDELGLDEDLINDEKFIRFFSGDISVAKKPMKPYGWATGYALSIYGTEYTHQCPFRTGNGYGDGRAISVYEGIFKGKRWEMQLKGGGPTPYCRGADGRAVLRSSIREFLVQEFMHALGVPTSRSLTLFTSNIETAKRPWYKENSNSIDPEILLETPVAISTRVASSFLRIGQIELFYRRARSKSHNDAEKELELIVKHLIYREYQEDIDTLDSFSDQILSLANLYQERLTSLVANWIRVGYCQGNFNSDNCSAGGFTLDYGPFGFCELFDPNFQPWIGGGDHFSFLNQSKAAEENYNMFCNSLLILLKDERSKVKLNQIKLQFKNLMNKKLHCMWSKKLGLKKYDEALVTKLLDLMFKSKVDFTIFFRSLSEIPIDISGLKKSFYQTTKNELNSDWNEWLMRWRSKLNIDDRFLITKDMKLSNPKYTWREWLVAPVYKEAEKGDFSKLAELQYLFQNPYKENIEFQDKFDCLRPNEFSNVGGITHYSCSS